MLVTSAPLVAAALADFSPAWDQLTPKEQARVVRLLVERTHGAARPQTLTFTSQVRFTRAAKGRLEMAEGPAPDVPPAPQGRVPKISRLMALAIRFQRLLETGEVRDYAELARLGHVTRARLTQVMNLTLMAPDIQEAILFLPLVTEGRDPLKEWQVRPIAAEPLWAAQRRMWTQLATRNSPAA